MSVLAVIGKPVGHSLSPQLHSYAAKLAGLSVLSFRCELEPHMLGRFVEDVRRREEFAGFNVTMPYKAQILGHLDRVDAVASKLSAVNTVVRKNGKLEGHNTDWVAFRDAVMSRGDAYDSALVVGAGGAAAAAVYALLNPKPLVERVYVYNRSEQRLNALKSLFPQISTYDGGVGYDVVVNATPIRAESALGRPFAARLIVDFPYTYYGDGISEAYAEKASYVDGLELLARQGVEAMRLFLGVDVGYLPVYQWLKKFMGWRRTS